MAVSDMRVIAPSPDKQSEERTAEGALFLLPGRKHLWGKATRAALVRSMSIYLAMFTLAIALLAVDTEAFVDAFALGLIIPGGGFLLWALPGASMQSVTLVLFAGSLAMFLLATVIWFATGNVFAPPLVWLLAALGAAGVGVFQWDGTEQTFHVWQTAVLAVPVIAISTLVLVWGTTQFFGHRGLRRREQLNAYLKSNVESVATADQRPRAGDLELSKEDLQLMRLLLDRALQPIEAFEGFEWIDQFQTAAVRYQINFMSYALSIAQAVHVPAFRGYMHTAQKNLIAKQQDHRIWRYWYYENMWGNLRMTRDPIPDDNIMFTGFLAAQIAYHQNASGKRTFDVPDSLLFRYSPDEQYAYSLPALIDVLVAGYGRSEYGLLACEPNWIYPLCNAISASAVRACDTVNGTAHWDAIEPSFRHSLETEFITPGGRMVPCRSSYTGFAVPPIGGAVMQAFPCFFLNTILPDVAQRQWQVLRHDLANTEWKRKLWPVDIGNYRFSRATSYAATAAAAVELGDSESAKLLLQHLDDECPLQVSDNVARRTNASLWAHAMELIARCGTADAARTLVHAPRRSQDAGPFIRHADYPDVLVARAVAAEGCLSAVLYPGEGSGFRPVTIGGLVPNQSYLAIVGEEYRFGSDQFGNARLQLPLDGRTELRITPKA